MNARIVVTAAGVISPIGAGLEKFGCALFSAKAAGAVNSLHAVANLKTLCAQYLPDRHEIEIVDVYQAPQRALADGVMMTPTLIRIAPAPVRRIVGTLSQTPTIVQALGLEPAADGVDFVEPCAGFAFVQPHDVAEPVRTILGQP